MIWQPLIGWLRDFASPLEGAQADTNLMKTEFTDMIGYAVQYISLSSIEYHSVWWRLFNTPNSAEWSNILVLDELLFSLLASNGKLERIFSLLGTITVEKISRLTNEFLDDLLLLKSDKTLLSNFNPDPSIDLWLSAMSRRHHRRKERNTDNVEVMAHHHSKHMKILVTVNRRTRFDRGTS